ncbi:MAG: hypothetical protein Q7S52_01495 [bacterium]|nr:hypothetical protein [bacterium]
MPTTKITGKKLPDHRIHHIQCIEGHIAAFERDSLLSAQGVSCPFCNTPILLSEDDRLMIRSTRRFAS